MIRYDVRPDDHDAFLATAARLRTSRRRTGGTSWRLYLDGTDGNLFVEEYTVPSSEEFTEQNTARATAYDQDLVSRIEQLSRNASPPGPRFLLAD